MDTIRSSRVRAGSPPTAVSIVAVSGAPPTSRASYRLLTVRACSWELEKKKSVINGGNGACHMGQMGCETRLKLHGELPCGEARFGDDDEATDAHVEPVDGEREGKCRRRINPPLRGARGGVRTAGRASSNAPYLATVFRFVWTPAGLKTTARSSSS